MTLPAFEQNTFSFKNTQLVFPCLEELFVLPLVCNNTSSQPECHESRVGGGVMCPSTSHRQLVTCDVISAEFSEHSIGCFCCNFFNCHAYVSMPIRVIVHRICLESVRE